MRLLLLICAALASGCASGTTVCYVDDDGDGFGQLAVSVESPAACGDEAGESVEGGDCLDTDPDTFPGAEERPDDGIDQDCNGIDAALCRPDEDDDGWGGSEPYTDLDGDCRDQGDLPTAFVGDCDDSNPDVNPASPELPDDGIDQDCSGADAVTCYYDGDGDGFGAPVSFASADADCDDDFEAAEPGDCDDSADWIHPGADDEPGDGFDADCDGVDPALCYLDDDGDGLGGDETVVEPAGSCDLPGRSWYTGDCDDTSALFHPFAFDEADDGLDQNCNGVDSAFCYWDGDEDGYGWPGGGFTEVDGDCLDDPFHAAVGDDCDDNDDSIHPGAPDAAGDGEDSDCDGVD